MKSDDEEKVAVAYRTESSRSDERRTGTFGEYILQLRTERLFK
jgi:hypothetical protein